MDPPERDVPPRADDPNASVDNLPWLQDEKPPAPRAVAPPVVPAAEGDRGPWWGRFVRHDAAPQPRSPAVTPDGRARPFDGPPDAGTVVASRDELLRAVREYMGSRGPKKSVVPATDAPPPAHACASAPNESPPEAEEALAVDVEPGGSDQAPLPSDAGDRGKGDIFDVLASRRAQAPPPPIAPEPPRASSSPVPPSEGLRVIRPRPASSPDGQAPPRGDALPTPGDEAPPPAASDDDGEAPSADRSTTRRMARPRTDDTLTSGSAMNRERVLPSRGEGGRTRSRPVPQTPDDISLSSFAIEANPRDMGRFPEGFVSAGLRFLVTRQWGPALEHYRLETRKHPKDVYNMYGMGAALFGLDRLEESAAQLIRAHETDPDFPLAHLIINTRPDDPIGWYNLAAALVSERTRSAYQCAEIVLTECLGGADDEALRGRAQRVQQDIARMLDERTRQDEVRQHDGNDSWLDTLRNPAVLAGLVVLVLLLFFAWRSLTRPVSVPAASPSAAVASPIPARGQSASPAPPAAGRRR